MSYEINYNDERFAEVEADKKAALSEVEKTYGGMIKDSDKFYQAQIDASKQWADTQTKLQNEKTDFAIEQIEQQKDQTKKDYLKEQSGAYVDWQKQSNNYGANAEKMASQGMTNTGYSESSQVSMYNTYQNRVATAREAYSRAVLNYDNAIKDARLQNNSALAEIAYQALQQQLELSLEGFQYKNTLIQAKADKKTQLDSEYYSRYQDVLKQINTENALAEEVRQHNESLAMEKKKLAEEQRQFNETMAFEREQYEYQKAKTTSSSGGSYQKKKTTSSSSNSSKKVNDSKKEITSQKNISDGGGATIDTKSVLKAGLGPASGDTIAKAVANGKVTAKKEGNKIVISKNKTFNTSALNPQKWMLRNNKK